MSTIAKREFQLGGIVGGKLYFYTAIPCFRSLDQALKHQKTRPNRNACDVIVEIQHMRSAGVVYGYRHVLRSAIDGEILP
jgi:hypothetical protein